MWNLNAPTFSVVICSVLTAPQNGNIFVTRSTVGGVVIYTCDVGYMLMGMEQRVCQQNGQWFGIAPTCAEIPEIG